MMMMMRQGFTTIAFTAHNHNTTHRHHLLCSKRERGYLVGKNTFMSSVSLGHPNTEKGKRPELNQVSSTSSS